MFHIDPTNVKRKLIFNNGNKSDFTIGAIGVNSYINSMDIHVSPGDEIINIQIGSYCSVAYNVLALINRNHDYKSITNSTIPPLNFNNKRIKQKGQILIGNDVWIGNNVILLSGIKIGNGSVVGAGTVVSKDVPPYAIAVGNPMRIIKYRFNEEEIKKLLSIQWWNWDYDIVSKRKDWFAKDINEFTERFYIDSSTPKTLSMESKNTKILLIPDFSEFYPVWKKVIKEFIDKFTGEDDVTLIIRMPQNNEFNDNIEMISDLIDGVADLPDILILNDDIEDERSLFADMSYYVATRSIDTMKYVELADMYNVEILSGVDIPVFVKDNIIRRNI